MLGILLVLLILFWLGGYGPFSILSTPILVINGARITLWDILIFMLFMWIIGSLPSPFSQILGLIVIIWLLSTLGLFSFITLPFAVPNILVILVIIALLIYLIGGF